MEMEACLYLPDKVLLSALLDPLVGELGAHIG